MSVRGDAEAIPEPGRERSLRGVVRYERLLRRELARLVDLREPLEGDHTSDLDAETAAEAWSWSEEVLLVMICANQVGKHLKLLGWTENYPVRVTQHGDDHDVEPWLYVTHLRNALEHDDENGKYAASYGPGFRSAVWGSGQPGFLARLDLGSLGNGLS